MPKRYQPVAQGAFERRQFHSLSDVRREMVQLYWQAKSGKIDKGVLPGLVKLLDLIGHYMVETEAEIQAQQLRQQIEQVRQELISKGVAVPAIIDMTAERVG